MRNMISRPRLTEATVSARTPWVLVALVLPEKIASIERWK